MANTQLKVFLLCVCILATQTTKGVYGQCSTSPKNLAAYEGTQNTMMTCNSPTKVAWMLKSTSSSLDTYKLTNYDDNVASAYMNLFGVNQAGLIIKTAQGSATIPPISTAGLYIVNYPNSNTKGGAKFLVVRQPPTCSCTTINSTHIHMKCSVTFSDSSYHPIDAKMTWTSNGNFYANDTPTRTMVYPYFVSTSTITVNATDSATYQCKVTFRKPTNIQFPYVAKNAPDFSASCTSECPCKAPLRNIVVHEGDLNTFIYYPTSPNGVKWSITATTDELTPVDIVNYNDAVDPLQAADYALGPSGLTIKTATINTADPGHRQSTAGLYTVECGGNRVSFKILVVRSGPSCSRVLPDTTTIKVTCSAIYADSTYDPIAAIFTLYVNGSSIASATPQRTNNDPYTFISSVAFPPTAYSSSSTYECGLTFGQPMEIQDPNIAMNAPTFDQKCTA